MAAALRNVMSARDASLAPVLIVFLAATFRNVACWDPEDCPNFCQCFWLYGLKWADCTGHRLYSIQTGVNDAVQALDLSNNSVSSLGNYELRDAGLARLKLLNLSSNSISEIGLMAFVDLAQLRVLDLSKNHLYSILPDTFAKNLKLEVLTLAGNNLNQRVPKLRSSSLGSMNLSNCGISHLPVGTFDELPRLRILDVTDNVMIQLDLDVARELPNLQVFMIERNPWSCNGNMRELQRHLRTRRIHFQRVCESANARGPEEINSVAMKSEKMIMMVAPPRGSNPAPNTGSLDRLLEKFRGLKNSLSMTGTTETINRCDQSPQEVGRSGQDGATAQRTDEIFASLSTIPAYWFLAVGFLLGSAIGAIFTYFWLTFFCNASSSSRHSSHRHEIAIRRPVASEIANQRINLLQNFWQSNDDADGEGGDAVRSATIRELCPGTPPPAYRDVVLNSGRYPRPIICPGGVYTSDTNDHVINEQ